MANRRIRSGENTCRRKLPPISSTKATAFSSVGTADKYITLLFPDFQKGETSQLGHNKALLSFQGRKLNQHSCLRIDDGLLNPPIRQVGKKCERSFKEVSGVQAMNKNDKMDKQMSRSRYMPQKDATVSARSEKVPRNAVHLLQRRLNPDRMYQQSNGRMSYEELLAFDQNIDQLPAFTERDVKWINMKELNGKKIDPKTTGNDDITLYVEQFEHEGKKRRSFNHDKRLSFEKETKVRVESRFCEALDLHYYHRYRNTHPGRRMAICEEIERKIVINDVALSCVREHLSLQEVLNTWIV